MSPPNCLHADPFLISGLPKFKCAYGVPQERGLEATTIICEKCARKEVHIKGNFADDDPCFTRIPRECNSMGAANVLHERSHGVRPRICLPHKGPLSEYRDQYRRLHPKSGPKQTHFSTMVENRPGWNKSIAIPPKPYIESFQAAEAKLKALDNAEEPIPETLLIARQRIYDNYHIARDSPARGVFKSGYQSCPVSIGPPCGKTLELYEDDSYMSET